MKKQLANMLTGCRILSCGALLLVPVFSVPFYIVYALCGLSDMLDGTVARKTGGVSRLGARLDSAADLLLTAVVLGRLLPVLSVPGWLWVWVAVTAALRLLNILCGFFCQKTLVMLHDAEQADRAARLSPAPDVPLCAALLQRAGRLRSCDPCGNSGGALYLHRARHPINHEPTDVSKTSGGVLFIRRCG